MRCEGSVHPNYAVGTTVVPDTIKSCCTFDFLKDANHKVIDGFGSTDERLILIDSDYDEAIRQTMSL